MIATLLMSLGGAAVNAAANTLVSTLYGDRRGPMLNVLGVFGAAGSVSVPLVFSGVTTYAQVHTRLLLLGGACGLAGVLHLLQPRPTRAGVIAAPRGTTRAALKDPWVVALTLLLIIDFGNEAVMAGWIAPYTLAEVPDGVCHADGGAVLGRPRRGSCPDAVRAGAHLEARAPRDCFVGRHGGVCGDQHGADTRSRSALAVLLTGLAIAPMAPTTLSVAGDRYPRNTGRCSACCCRSGSSGA